ncbi:unnamed protein product [Caenorhabditis bovis]|uniref:Choline/carnitine acyltransferase domain-containing protein n=1 Tax=Caenorhabditis bovis TaxID=2654633 RepID=A0A8S1E3V9_9PELO|nr:unnamed protein product [Caenorhabditis bovis]
MAGQSKPQSPYELVEYVPGTLERLWYRTYNWFENRLWPIRPLPFLTLSVAGTAIQTSYYDKIDFSELQFDSIDDTHLKIVRSLLISIGIGYTTTFILRQILKHFYFSYKGYLFENPKNPSIRTKLWGATRAFLSKFAPPKLSSCDSILPNLPLPNLADSVRGYIESMKHLISDEEYESLKKYGDEFLNNEGWKLQLMTWFWHKCAENYVTPLWQKFVYNSGRYPLLINSSVGQITTYGNSGNLPAYHVTRLIYIETLANIAIDKQQYNTPGGGLVSTRHYRNLYNGCRIPGEKYDYFQWNRPATHVIVFRRGIMYKMNVCDNNSRIYTIDEMTKIIAEMMQRDDETSDVLSKICSLTHDNRTEWHRNRKRFFLKNKKNKKLLDVIETAAFDVSVDDDTEWHVETTEKLSIYMKDMLAGNGKNRWADKTMNYAVDSTGRGGATGEHSPCDASELDHLCENELKMDKEPDGFMQMSIQLANYKDQGKFVLTYEPGAIRSFANSRTETVRPVTEASCKFVKAMLDEDTTVTTGFSFCEPSCETHVRNCKNVLIGRGFDRHLFVLCAMAKGFGFESKFLDHFANQKWLLSTSNIPNMTNSIDEDKSIESICLGGAFGAVAENGYGVCYRFAGNKAIMVHTTSYHSAENTSSRRFAETLRESMNELANLFDS